MRKTIAAALAFGLSLCTAQAADFSFAGTFQSDDDVRFFPFVVGAASNVTLRSYSYAGGVQANGTIVAAGGFDPILALFAADGTLIEEQDDADFGVPDDPVTGFPFDVNFQAFLPAGAYTVTIQQFSNFAVGPTISDGFLSEGLGNFTGPEFGCSNGIFCDVDGFNRTSAWAFDILNVELAVVVDPAVVPLPAGLPLLLAGLGALVLVPRRR